MNTTDANGNHLDQRPVAGDLSQLPEHRTKAIEAGLAAHQTLLAERERIEDELYIAKKRIGELEVQIDALQSMVGMIESTAKSLELTTRDRIEHALKMRDEYSERALTAETSLMNAYRILHDAVNERRDDAPAA